MVEQQTEDMFQFMHSTLIPALSEYSSRIPVLAELASQNDLTLNNLKKIDQLLRSIRVPPAIVVTVNHLLWVRKALASLEEEPFTAAASDIFLECVEGLHQELSDKIDFKINLINYLCSVQTGISDATSSEEVRAFVKGLKYIRDKFGISDVDSALEWAEIQLQNFLWNGMTDTTFSSINRQLEELYKIDELNIGFSNEDMKEISASMGIFLLEEESQPKNQATEILGKIHNLNLNNQEILNEVHKLEGNYGISKYEYIPNYMGIVPPQRIIADTEEVYISSKDELVIDDRRPLYAKGEGDPKVFIYKGSLRNNSDVKVAIKEYVASSTALLRDYVNQEQNALRKTSGLHRSFLKFYGSYHTLENEEQVFGLAMELCKESLAEEITKRMNSDKPYSPNELVDRIVPILEGFTILHSNNIFHKDMKPHNLLISYENVPKIADFNISEISNLSNVTAKAQTELRLVQGTDGYMAPEIQRQFNKRRDDRSIADKVEVNPIKADIYGLGLTFLQMWTLNSVKDLNQEDNQGQLNEIIRRVNIQWMKDILTLMLKYNPHERPDKVSSIISMIPQEIMKTVSMTSVIS